VGQDSGAVSGLPDRKATVAACTIARDAAECLTRLDAVGGVIHGQLIASVERTGVASTGMRSSLVSPSTLLFAPTGR
jgi:hypothetical protein